MGAQHDVLIIHPFLFCACQYGDAVAEKMLIAVAQSLQVGPATKEIIDSEVSCDRDVQPKMSS